MPIGFNPGDSVEAAPANRHHPGRRRQPDDQPGIDDVLDEIGRGLWNWVAVLTRTVTPVVWTRWTTAADERTCPECAPLDGLIWPDGAGPVPPCTQVAAAPACRPSPNGVPGRRRTGNSGGRRCDRFRPSPARTPNS